MNLVPEKFKIIPKSYNGYDFMKIQYEDKDLVKKLKGEFHIIEVKKYGLHLVFTPDDYSIIDKIYELGGYKNEENKKNIFLSMNKQLHFSITKTFSWIKTNAYQNETLKKIKMRGCVAVCFSSFSNSYDRLNAYAKQVKVNEFLKEEEIESVW